MIEATGPTRLTGHVVWAEPGNEWKVPGPGQGDAVERQRGVLFGH